MEICFFTISKAQDMKKPFLLILFLLTLCMVGCQGEEGVQVVGSEQNLNKTSTLTTLIARVCQNPTFNDNCIDDSSCFSVVLPVAVTVNGQTVNVQTEADYNTIKTIKKMGNCKYICKY